MRLVKGKDGRVQRQSTEDQCDKRGNGVRMREVMSCQRLLYCVETLPAGILSTKDALDDGNAYDSAVEATAGATISVALRRRQCFISAGL